MQYHSQRGSILEHYRMQHKIKPTKEQLITNTKILDKATDKYRLAIKESLLIIANNPSINRQYNNFTNILKL